MKMLNSTLEKKSNNKGFTLYELVIVIAIISICSALLFTEYNKIVEKYGNDTTPLQELKQEYNFSYYDDLLLPNPVDYEEILKRYLTDEEIEKLKKEIYDNTNLHNSNS